jgi:hypothetical protein
MRRNRKIVGMKKVDTMRGAWRGGKCAILCRGWADIRAVGRGERVGHLRVGADLWAGWSFRCRGRCGARSKGRIKAVTVVHLDRVY